MTARPLSLVQPTRNNGEALASARIVVVADPDGAWEILLGRLPHPPTTLDVRAFSSLEVLEVLIGNTSAQWVILNEAIGNLSAAEVVRHLEERGRIAPSSPVIYARNVSSPDVAHTSDAPESRSAERRSTESTGHLHGNPCSSGH